MPIKIRTTRNKARGHKVPQLAASTKDQSSRTAAAAAALVRWMSFRTIFGAAPLHTLLLCCLLRYNLRRIIRRVRYKSWL